MGINYGNKIKIESNIRGFIICTGHNYQRANGFFLEKKREKKRKETTHCLISNTHTWVDFFSVEIYIVLTKLCNFAALF